MISPEPPHFRLHGSAASAAVNNGGALVPSCSGVPSTEGVKKMRGSAPSPAGGNDFPRAPSIPPPGFAASAEERSCLERAHRKIWRFSAGKTTLQKIFLRASAHFSPHFDTNTDAENGNASFLLFGLSAKQFQKRRLSTAGLREPSWRSVAPAGPAPSCRAWPTWPSETAPDRTA